MLHSTGEAGEPVPGDPVEGRGHRIMDPLEGKMTGVPNPTTISTKLQRIAICKWLHSGLVVVQRTRDPRSRMRQSRTSGSVGGLGWQRPGPTRR